MTKRNTSTQVDAATARKSVLLVSTVMFLFGGWKWYRGSVQTGIILGALAIVLVVIGLFVPPFARRFHVTWMKLATILGHINSRILLSIMFYGVITPIGLITRAVGRDPLRRRGDNANSYWIPRTVTRQTREGFERAF